MAATFNITHCHKTYEPYFSLQSIMVRAEPKPQQLNLYEKVGEFGLLMPSRFFSQMLTIYYTPFTQKTISEERGINCELIQNHLYKTPLK